MKPLIRVIKIRTQECDIEQVKVQLIAAGHDLDYCEITTIPFCRTGTLPNEWDWDVFVTRYKKHKGEVDG